MSSGKKYLRSIRAADSDAQINIDVYSVLVAFGVSCPAIQHTIKKLLCAGQRGKGDRQQDIQESIDALQRALQLIPEERIQQDIDFKDVPFLTGDGVQGQSLTGVIVPSGGQWEVNGIFQGGSMIGYCVQWSKSELNGERTVINRYICSATQSMEICRAKALEEAEQRNKSNKS